MTKVSIIIPNRNNVALLGLTMRSVFEDCHDLPYEYEVLIADNSDEKVYNHIKNKLISTKFGYKFLHENVPCLFYSFDKAIQSASGKYIIRIDSDMLCGKDMIVSMVKFMEEHKDIGFGHAPVNFFSQTPAAAQHEVGLEPGLSMCRWAGQKKVESKITYKGMPWICKKEWYLKTLNGFGALRDHQLTPFGDPYLGLKSWLIGYENWGIPCRPGIHLGRMDSCKPFEKFMVNSKTGNYNSFMTACVTAYVLTNDVEKWAPIFIRVGSTNSDTEKAVVNYYRDNKKTVELIGAEDKKWFEKNKKYSFEDLIKKAPWRAPVEAKKFFYERHFPIWKSISGKRSQSCIKQDDWNVIRGLVRTHKIKNVLEFGSGFSTILLSKLGINVVSYETDQKYINAVESVICSKRVQIKYWDNKTTFKLDQKFDMAIVDGIRPRTLQAEIAKAHADIVLVHDIGASSKGVPEKVLPDWINIKNNSKRSGVFIKPKRLEAPVVSVIISHRHDFAMLGITVRSVLEDCIDLTGFIEVVICDNSVTATENIDYVIAPEFIKSGMVRVLYQKHACLFTAREKAIKEAKGKYIICLDSHVLCGRHMIRDMVEYMEKAPENIGFAHAPLVYVSQGDKAQRHEFKTRRYFDKPHKVGIKGMPWICKKTFWNEIKGYGVLAEHKMSWGGGDVYLALKPWLLGYENWSIPCRPGIHIGPFTKLDRKYYRYRYWGKSGETAPWYGLLAASYVFGLNSVNNDVTQLRWYHCQSFENNNGHWNKIKQMCSDERKWLQQRQVIEIKELLSNKPWA